MAIAIVAATSREMRAALGFASGAPEVRRGRDEVWSLDDRQFVLSVTGIGVVNAALAMGRLLQRGGLDGVVNLGLAGAFDPRALPLRTPCLVRREIWPEIGLAGSGSVDPRGLGLAQGTVDGRPVWDRIDLAPEASGKRMGVEISGNWQRVVSLTVSAVTGTLEDARRLELAYDADVENMEGFALAFGAAGQGVPFVELRTVSNRVGSRDPADWDLDGALGVLAGLCASMFMNR